MHTPEYYMARAIQLAERGLYSTDPNPRVGCVIVKANQIVGEGWHQRAGEAHAEVHALQAAGEQAKDADCYVTLEPCSHYGRTPPCADALIAAQVKRVFIAVRDPNPLVSGSGIDKLRDAGIEVQTDVLTAAASELNVGFLKRMRTGLPWVRTKVAMSMDGRTAMASGESKWITSPASRMSVQQLRARSSAILTGVDTIIADDPLLTVRADDSWYPHSSVRQPLRVVLDSQIRIPDTAKILNGDNTLLVSTIDKIAPKGVEQLILPEESKTSRVALHDLMIALGERGLNEVMVEAGATLNGALLQAGLVDELVIYMAPKLMGADARGAFQFTALDKLADNIGLKIKDIRQVGDDLSITAQPEYSKTV